MYINQLLPSFTVQAFHDLDFKTITNIDLLGSWSVLFFYPADFTFVCPTELGDMADHCEELKSMGVNVYSVSTDTHFTHMAWHESSDTIKKITFPMLADPSGALSRSMGVYNEKDGLAIRATFVIDPSGRIRIVEQTDDGIGRNAAELVRKIRAAQYVDAHDGEACPAKWKPGDDTLKPGKDLVGKI